MKHYWINVDRCTDRREFMEQQFKKHQIANTRISAETPQTISKYTIIYNSNQTDLELSLTLSHLKALKQGYDDGDEYFCVTEDDINLPNIDFTKILQYMKDTNDNVECLQLSTVNDNTVRYLIQHKEIMVKRPRDCWGSYYYLISRAGALKLLNTIVKSLSHYDLSMFSLINSDDVVYLLLNTYVMTYPLLTTNTDYGSIIHPDHIYFHQKGNDVVKSIHKENNMLHLYMK
jgi:GR25 family glycosyltransferase involved in LPS biosynthesis